MPATPITRAEFSHFKRRIITFAVIISLGCAGSIWKVYNESNTRTAQFCEINVARANDSVKRFDESVRYVAHPDEGFDPTLIKVIKERSLPSLARTVDFDKSHRAEACEDVTPPYADTKYPDELKFYLAKQVGP